MIVKNSYRKIFCTNESTLVLILNAQVPSKFMIESVIFSYFVLTQSQKNFVNELKFIDSKFLKMKRKKFLFFFFRLDRHRPSKILHKSASRSQMLIKNFVVFDARPNLINATIISTIWFTDFESVKCELMSIKVSKQFCRTNKFSSFDKIINKGKTEVEISDELNETNVFLFF